VREEAGLDAEPVEKLGDVSYWYVRGGRRVLKVVSFFLFRYRAGSVRNHDHEVEQALWMPLDDAAERLAYKGEPDMAAAALSKLARGR
jgi:8-oxo-dGTP pyrophosphatase MutT (NUDIX family)